MRALPETRAPRRLLVVVLALAASLRLVPVLLPGALDEGRVFTADSRAYVELARGLIDRHAFVRFPPEGEARIGNPWPTEVFRTPGYPAVIAIVLGTGGSFGALVVLQILFDLAAILLCADIGRRMGSAPAGLAAAGLLAVDLVHIVYANMVMSDVVFAALVTASVWLTVRGADEAAGPPARRTALLAGAGLAMSCASAVRPVAALAGIPLAWYAAGRRGGRVGAALLLAASLVFPVGWVCRNAVENGVTTLSNAHTFNLYLLAASRVKARAEGIEQAEAFRQVVDAAVGELKARGPGHWAEALHAAGGWVYRAYPAATAAEAARGLAEMLVAGERRMVFRLAGSPRGDDRPAGINQRRRELGQAVEYLAGAAPVETAVVGGQLILNASVTLLAAAGLSRLWRGGRAREALLAGSLIAYFLLASLTVASARMRAPVSFLLDLAAAAALVDFRRSDAS